MYDYFFEDSFLTGSFICLFSVLFSCHSCTISVQSCFKHGIIYLSSVKTIIVSADAILYHLSFYFLNFKWICHMPNKFCEMKLVRLTGKVISTLHTVFIISCASILTEALHFLVTNSDQCSHSDFKNVIFFHFFAEQIHNYFQQL